MQSVRLLTVPIDPTCAYSARFDDRDAARLDTIEDLIWFAVLLDVEHTECSATCIKE